MIIFSCREASILAEKELHAPLTLAERVAYNIHLKTCVLCRRYRTQRDLVQRWLGNQIHAQEAANPMPSSIRDAIQKELDKKLGERS